MPVRVNPKLIGTLERYGAQDVSKCYHCGNCSAVCPFSKAPYVFPRRSMRFLQMGLEKRLEGSLEPWLCYYCGQCSQDCPRDAEPGETMMSLRRWLTSRYDFTGISGLFYRSGRFEVAAVLIVALLTAVGFLAFGFAKGSIRDYDGANAFLPSSSIHVFDWALAGVLVVLLLINAGRMWWYTVGRDRTVRIPLASYLKCAYLLPLHFLTQKRYANCERKQAWAIHLGLVLSYLTMLVLIMFFLGAMQSGPATDYRVHAFGYVAAAGLLVTTFWALRGRLTKRELQHRHSHGTDWLFLVMLAVVTATGILQHVVHRAGFDMAANLIYVVHLMAVVPMLGLEVPFSKWAHLAYRPLAMYFAELRTDAMAAASRTAPQAQAARTA